MQPSEVSRFEEVDVNEIQTFLKACWLDSYTGILPDSAISKVIDRWQSKDAIIRAVQNARLFYAGWKEQGKLLRLVSAGKIDEETIKIYQLYVLPSHQRKGIGTKLMDAATRFFRNSKKIVLEVEEGNEKGLAFYRKYGFSYPKKTLVEVDGDKIPCLLGELELSVTMS